MNIGISADSGMPEPVKKKKPAKSGVKKNDRDKIEELKKKVEQGYYNGTDIVDKIVNKILKDI